MPQILQSESLATLTVDDLDRVTMVHCAAFPESFLSALGPATVRRYYQWLLTGPHEVVTALGVRCDQELVGFALGGVFRGALSGFLKKHYMVLAWSLTLRPWVLARRAHRDRLVAGVRTIVPFLRCEVKTEGVPRPVPKTLGIIAIAVHPQYGRSGYGGRLMAAFDQIARDGKFSRMQLRVNPSNQAAIAFYCKLGWSKLAEASWTGVMFKPVIPDPNK